MKFLGYSFILNASIIFLLASCGEMCLYSIFYSKTILFPLPNCKRETSGCQNLHSKRLPGEGFGFNVAFCY